MGAIVPYSPPYVILRGHPEGPSCEHLLIVYIAYIYVYMLFVHLNNNSQ